MFDDYLRERIGADGRAVRALRAERTTRATSTASCASTAPRAFLASRGIVLPDEEVRALARRKDQLVLDILHRERVETYEGSVRFVEAARDAGLQTAVVSASKHCQEVLESAGIADLFDARIDGNVAAEQHLAGKPAPDTFLAAARAVGVTPAEAAVFEDAHLRRRCRARGPLRLRGRRRSRRPGRRAPPARRRHRRRRIWRR